MLVFASGLSPREPLGQDTVNETAYKPHGSEAGLCCQGSSRSDVFLVHRLVLETSVLFTI